MPVETQEKPAWRLQIEKEADFQVSRDRYPRHKVIADVRRLSRVSGLHSAIIIAEQWLVIILALAVAIWSGHWAVYVVSGIVIAAKFQCLGVLFHDGAHFLLFSNRHVNDLVCDLFVAFPLGLSTTLYRRGHLIHHRHTNTDLDPDVELQRTDSDFRWPKTRWGCLSVITRSIFGLNVHRLLRATRVWSPTMNLFTPIGPAFPLRARFLFVISIGMAYLSFYLSGILIPIIILFTIPTFTMLNVTNRIRVLGEHMRLPVTHELNSTRTVVPNVVERFFIAPYGVSYHIEHHLFPSVPGRHLPELHRVLMHDDEFRKHAHVTTSYLALLIELMTPAPETVTPRLR